MITVRNSKYVDTQKALKCMKELLDRPEIETDLQKDVLYQLNEVKEALEREIEQSEEQKLKIK